ncbi:hypothetical protein Lal_00016909, partial [Lupinus albus]
MSFARGTPVSSTGDLLLMLPLSGFREWIGSFRAMNCSEAQKLAYATYMLVKEAENWWEFTRRQMEIEGQLISWGTFKEKFLHKYFPADLKRKKGNGVPEGNMSVGEYAAKFEELARFCPYSELEVDGRSKCSKFESGLRPKLKIMFGHQEIADFATLNVRSNLKSVKLATHETITPPGLGPQRNHMRERRVKRGWKMTGSLMRQLLYIETEISKSLDHLPFLQKGFLLPCATNVVDVILGVHARVRKRMFPLQGVRHIKRFCPKLDRRPNVVSAEKTRDHSR